MYCWVIFILICIMFLKEQLFRQYREEQLPTFMKYLENILKQNKGGQGWFVGDNVSEFMSFII